MASPLSAAGAYANIARLTLDPARAGMPGIGSAPKGETSFTSVLKEAIEAVNETGQKSDLQTRALVNGKATWSTSSPRSRRRKWPSMPWSRCATR